MKLKLFLVTLFFLVSLMNAQKGFTFQANRNKIVIPFKFINNLIIIPIEVNGVSLNFLLDTGVEETILFSLDESDEVKFSQIESIKISGLGSKEPFDGFKTSQNILKAQNYIDVNHTLYLVLDQSINISSRVGIPVNGIVGYHFFQNNLIKIDYENHKIIIYNNKNKILKTLEKKYSKLPMVLKNGKPFIQAKVGINNALVNANLLVDTGNSDAVWLFQDVNEKIKVPILSFDDFLGYGMNGDIYGQRGRIEFIDISNNELKNPLVAFPDSISTKDIKKNDNRLGSLGSEVIKRFTTFFDYQSNMLYLKKNRFFSDVFSFNMSGIEVQHLGLQWITESYIENSSSKDNVISANEEVYNKLKYKFELKPIYVISNIRKDSPAAIAGLMKDDVIIKINNKNGYDYSLQEINELLKSEEDKTIKFEIERNKITMVFKFQLKGLL